MNATFNPEIQSCIDACQRCAVTCEYCAAACLAEEDVKVMRRCIILDRSCADICTLAASEMVRGSEFASSICSICAEICQACGDECAKHQTDHCRECATACHECATACLAMAD